VTIRYGVAELKNPFRSADRDMSQADYSGRGQVQTLGTFLAVVGVFAVGLSLWGPVRRRTASTATQSRKTAAAALQAVDVHARIAGSLIVVNAGGARNPEDDNVQVPADGGTFTTLPPSTTVNPAATPVTLTGTTLVRVMPASSSPAATVEEVPMATVKVVPAATVEVVPMATPKAVPAATPKAVPAVTVKSVPVATSKAIPAATPKAVAATTITAPKTTTTARPATRTTTARPATKATTAGPKPATTRPKTATTLRPKTTPAAGPAASCTASVDNRTPASGDNVVVTVTSTVPTTPFTVTAHYKSKDTLVSGVTNGDGVGSVTFDIGSPAKGYKVKVDVNISGKATCSTEFTPR
jgi:hypothetical protein